ncbi:MAG: N-acetylmuramoyl-L-alanine amidase [Bacteroidetes bacterium]|nr:N-acetylmuramoyl-L-alanine amidase [Bacteroidota bacterium]
MAPVIKNEKLNYNNIYILKIILSVSFTFLLLCSFSSTNPAKKWIIVIDAGHGDNDPGAIGSLSYEKNITLAIALKTGEYIEQNLKNAKVIYTRKNDTFVEVSERANIANKNNADLFISIHANWAPSKKILGTETFVMGLAKDAANLQVAMKENEVILLESDYSTKYEGFDPKSPESYIMFTLMQNVYQEQSTLLASKIQSQFKEKVSRVDRGVKQAGFWVLFMTTMPSVLVETGFITHPNEEKFLNSKEGQDFLASAIFRACREYITEIDSKSGISAVKNTEKPIEKDSSAAKPVEYGPLFMVQVATSSGRIEMKPENFKGLKNIFEIVENEKYKYASGSFKEYTEAVKHKKKIIDNYPDAFVIAVEGNKTVPLQQAIEQKKKNF